MVSKHSLTDLVLIGEGAAGRVYSTSFRLPGWNGGRLAYKEYFLQGPGITPATVKGQVDSLRRLVAFRERLNESERAELERIAVWPLAAVTDGGKVVGGLMPLLPDQFFIKGKDRRLVLGLEYLPAKNAVLNKIFSTEQIAAMENTSLRVALTANLAYAIAWLHAHGLVYGDLSLKNAAFSIDPPAVMLMDCDGVALQSDPLRRQLNTAAFIPPELLPIGTNPHARGNSHLQDTRTDVYKLALATIRSLSKGQGATQLATAKHLSGDLPASLIRTLETALSQNPDQRPTSKALFESLRKHLIERTSPPEVLYFYPASTVVPRGLHVTFFWNVDDPHKVRRAALHCPDGRAVDLSCDTSQHSLRLDASGIYTLELIGSHFRQTVPSSYIQVFDAPQFDFRADSLLKSIVPSIPTLPPVTLPSFSERILEVPRVSLGTVVLPQLSDVGLDNALDAIEQSANRLTPPSLPSGGIPHMSDFTMVHDDSTLHDLMRQSSDVEERLSRIIESSLSSFGVRLRSHVEKRLRDTTMNRSEKR